jgi:hypothetical protein
MFDHLHKHNIPDRRDALVSIPIPINPIKEDNLQMLGHPRPNLLLYQRYILEQVQVFNFRSVDQIPRLGLNVQALSECKNHHCVCHFKFD